MKVRIKELNTLIIDIIKAARKAKCISSRYIICEAPPFSTGTGGCSNETQRVCLGRVHSHVDGPQAPGTLLESYALARCTTVEAAPPRSAW